MRPALKLAAALFLCLGPLTGAQAMELLDGVPKQLSQPVNDPGGMLSPEGAARIDRELRQAYANGQGAQVALLILPQIGDRAIEDVAIDVARSWGVGSKERGDGVLILVARKERKLRIEVGKRLEGVLTDIACKRIIEDVMVPRLRSGDIDGAIEAGVMQVLMVVAPGQVTAPSPVEEPRHERSSNVIPMLILLGLVVILNVISRALGFNSANRIGRGGWGGGFGGSGGGGFGGGGFGGGGGGFSGGGSSGSW